MRHSSEMNSKQWRDYALKRGRVANLETGAVGNLVEWCSGGFCKVFTGYGDFVGNYRPPLFETWRKENTRLESNEIQPHKA
jgi:hypothetical protein